MPITPIQPSQDTPIQLSQINIFPLKSARGISVSQWRTGQFGLEFDRRWMLVDEQGRFITQRRYPCMALIDVVLGETGIQCSAPDMPDLWVERPPMAKRKSVVIWRDTCQACDAGEGAATWFSEFLGIRCHLVYMPDDEFRTVDPTFLARRQPVSFADGFPVLLISEASLDDLNRRLEQSLPMRRFRPNLVVSGCEPYAEDDWKLIRIGDIEFDVVKPCSRCVMTTIDPETAIKGDEPLKTLTTYRKTEFGVCFGQNLVQRGNGIVRVGDPLEIVA